MEYPQNIRDLLLQATAVQSSQEPEAYIPPQKVVKEKPEPEEEVFERPRKYGQYLPKKSPGRGKGNLAKATVSRTASFRSALDDEDWEDIAIVTFNRMMDPDCRNGDFVKLATFLARYNLVSADAQLVVDSENGSLTADQIDILRSYLKSDGMPSPVNKHSLVPR